MSGSSIHGISHARILEWVINSFSRGSSQPKDRTSVFRIAGRFLTIWATKEAPSSSVVRHKLLWEWGKHYSTYFSTRSNWTRVVERRGGNIISKFWIYWQRVPTNLLYNSAHPLKTHPQDTHAPYTHFCPRLVSRLRLIQQHRQWPSITGPFIQVSWKSRWQGS